MTTTPETTTDTTPGKPWQVRLICCGRDDGTVTAATRGEAELIRSHYTSDHGPGAHERAAIITGPPSQDERDAGTALAEYLEAMRADKGVRGMVEECIALTAETAARAENIHDQYRRLLDEANTERGRLRGTLTAIRLIAEEAVTSDVDLLRRAILDQLPAAVVAEPDDSHTQPGVEGNEPVHPGRFEDCPESVCVKSRAQHEAAADIQDLTYEMLRERGGEA